MKKKPIAIFKQCIRRACLINRAVKDSSDSPGISDLLKNAQRLKAKSGEVDEEDPFENSNKNSDVTKAMFRKLIDMIGEIDRDNEEKTKEITRIVTKIDTISRVGSLRPSHEDSSNR